MSKQDNKNYYAEYYAKHRDAINERRLIRYHSDEEYRAKIKARSRDYNRSKRSTERKNRRNVIIDGVTCFTIGVLSEKIGRSINTIRQYHRYGIIPEVSNKDTRNWRLYTPKQMKSVRRAFKLFDDLKLKSLEDVKQYLRKERW